MTGENRTKAAAVLLLVALAAHTGAQAAHCDSQVSLEGGEGTLSEHSSYGLVAEDAFWPGVGVLMAQPLQTANLCGAIDIQARGGTPGTYDGFNQVGAPHSTDVTHVDFGAEFTLRQPVGDRLEWRALTAVERFDRAIQPKGFVGGVTEKYTWYWLGAGGEWQACPSCAYPVSVRATYAMLLDGKSAVDLFQFGNAVIDFDHGSKTVVEVSVQPPATGKRLPVVTLFWDKRDFSKTGSFPVAGHSYTVLQPAFNVQDVGVRLSFPIR